MVKRKTGCAFRGTWSIWSWEVILVNWKSSIVNVILFIWSIIKNTQLTHWLFSVGFFYSGMVYISTTTLDWAPLLKGWLLTQPQTEANQLLELFTASFPQTYQFVIRHLTLRSTVLEAFLIRQACDLLVGLIPNNDDRGHSAVGWTILCGNTRMAAIWLTDVFVTDLIFELGLIHQNTLERDTEHRSSHGGLAHVQEKGEKPKSHFHY